MKPFTVRSGYVEEPEPEEYKAFYRDGNGPTYDEEPVYDDEPGPEGQDEYVEVDAYYL